MWITRSVWLLATTALWATESSDHFEMRVRPVLAKHCYSCHSASRMGGLDLTKKDVAYKGGNSGPAIQPGKPDESLLFQVVNHTHAKLKMPPTGKLAEGEIAALRDWIRDGAVWPDKPMPEYNLSAAQRSFWSFQPVRQPALPDVKNRAWARNPIDRLILARMEAQGVVPVRPADKRTLLRRVYFDLVGLPPTADEIDTFVKDRSPDAYAKVVDRLLGSPHYGERWGRYWLDVARYSDDKLNSTMDDSYENAHRYRDWVIEAFNQDMPYDVFLKAQLAGDLLPGKEKFAAGLGFFGMSPEFQDDRVDALTRGFLGLTVACAQCHDHKFDPIPQKDYYSLLGVFNNTKKSEWPLAPPAQVKAYRDYQKALEDRTKELADYQAAQSRQLAEILAAQTAQYLVAVWSKDRGTLDVGTFERWEKYLATPEKDHPFLKEWSTFRTREQVDAFAKSFAAQVLAIHREKLKIDEENNIRLGGSREREKLSGADLVSLARDKWFLWKDLFSPQKGILYYKDDTLDRFLAGAFKDHLTMLRADVKRLKDAMPPQYPFLHIIADADTLKPQRIFVRGNRDNLGDEAPRRFLRILSDGEPPLFLKGSGRLELAEAIANPKNPLTARVIVNRVWGWHFGSGLVRTPSNFGQLGEKPTHPELLDYLAATFIAKGWSLKALHREILLSSTYALSAEHHEKNSNIDGDNRLLWRANRKRLDVESLRDAMLAVSGMLDRTPAGPAQKLSDGCNLRRTVYGFVSRRALDGTLGLFDFPNPNNTSEQRILTSTPLQRLFFLNSGFVMEQAQHLARRTIGIGDPTARIRETYRLAYGRLPAPEEGKLALDFVGQDEKTWARFAQVLLSANEFLFID